MKNTTWKPCTVGDVVELQRGYDLPEYERQPGTVPVIGSFGITGYHNTPRACGPGVTVGRSGASFGVATYSPVDYWPHNAVLFVTDFKGNLPRFVYYLLKTIDFQSLNSGSAQPSLNRNYVYPVRTRIPSLPTQRKIAGVLSAYDDLIENNSRRIAILEEMAQAIYRQWFVNFRFPGHEKIKLINSPLGKIPEGWDIVPLNDKLTVLETGSRPKGGVGEITEGMPSIGAESIMGAGQYDFAKTKYVPVAFFERMRQGILRDRDVLVYKDGGKPGYFIPHISFVGSGFPYSEMVINSHVYRLRATPPITQEFLYYHLSSEEMLQWMHLHGSGAAIPSIARKDLQQLPLIVPPVEVIRHFTEFAEPALTQILVLARKLQNLRQTRDLLLPKLISGQLDVEALDIEIPCIISDESFPLANQVVEPSAVISLPKESKRETPYKDDAAVLCALVDALHNSNRPRKEFFVQKHMFALKHRRRLPIHCQFTPQAAGPWSQELRRRVMHAAQGAGWLRFDESSKSVVIGRNFAKGLEHAKSILGERYKEVALLVDDLKNFGNSGLGRWMTVFKVVCDLQDAGKVVTRQQIQNGIDQWLGKRAKPDFSVANVDDTITKMVRQKWFALS